LAIVVLIVALAGVSFLLFFARGPGESQVVRETQVWWIASDPHIGHPSMRVSDNCLLVGIEDVNDYVENIEGVKVDYAILLGDLIHESTASQFREKLYQDMENLKVENWYYILGNHDFNNPHWNENVLPPVDMTLDVMGMKWILISDHMGDSGSSPPEALGGTMPENVREWFVNQVLSSDRPVFVFSHQPPNQWKAWNENLQRIANGSELFGWFYGHIHAWSATWLEDQVLAFSDCSLDWAKNFKGVFMFLEREGNTVNVTLRFRDHQNHEWIEIPFQGENVENISFSVKVA
jgi:predicted phosphodiesterase